MNTRTASFTAMAFTTALLQACATSLPAPPPAQAPQPPQQTTECDAARAQFAVGQMFNTPLAEEARQRSSSSSVRALRPDQAVTMEYNGSRLNLAVDAAGKILRARCG